MSGVSEDTEKGRGREEEGCVICYKHPWVKFKTAYPAAPRSSTSGALRVGLSDPQHQQHLAC